MMSCGEISCDDVRVPRDNIKMSGADADMSCADTELPCDSVVYESRAEFKRFETAAAAVVQPILQCADADMPCADADMCDGGVL